MMPADIFNLRDALKGAKSLQDWVRICHDYEIKQGFTALKRPVGVVLMLMVCEISEAMEAWRKNDSDNYEEEIADLLIRTFGHIGEMGFDIEAALRDKMEHNLHRSECHGKRA
jgi:NTP pyrophosphatase (non-canonical NTP hydrolase)